MKNKDPIGIEMEAQSLFKVDAAGAVARAKHKKENEGEINRITNYTVAVVENKKRIIRDLENQVRMLNHHIAAMTLEMKSQKLLIEFFEKKVREKLEATPIQVVAKKVRSLFRRKRGSKV